MKILINDIEHDVPFDLSLMTLGQFLDYYEAYGRELDKELKALAEKKYVGDEDTIEVLRTIDIDNHIDKEALAWFSFWTKMDFSAAKDEPFIAPVLTQYRILRYLLTKSEEDSYTFPAEIEWNGEKWAISNFTVTPASDMTFNEVITSKEVMRQVFAISRSQWDALPYLCAVFFRKKGEAFSDGLIIEGCERLELIKSLPMTHALRVAFFLDNCVSIWTNTLVSSQVEEVESVT
jgi:hypothetical protein